ncbi:citrate:proton symporter [Hyphococcus flavus]|uniref:Citrate:proton symporter n=1 Tax=Hyphococcus flavus TaxID=1866326 RepID=A0AAE9ZFA6_9PROT|nr:citrate:proton symporter [Hyphococcus flavus]WDI31833.1 citrate:proton symporter [Hyphococcus flavus]
MLTVIGLAIIAAVVAALLSGRISPVVGLTLPPLVGALIAGFGAPEITGFFSAGLAKVAPVAAMFIFAILFFGAMQDAGLFRPLINFLIRMTRGNVIAVAVGTSIAGMLAHLDGAGATTFLLTVPALAPVYLRLRMSLYLMLLLLAIGAGIFNMMPWAGPLGRAAAVIGVDSAELWRPLIAVQGVGAVMLVVFAATLGWFEQLRIARLPLQTKAATVEENEEKQPALSLSPVKIAFNVAIFIAVMAALIMGVLPAAYVFLIGLSLALPVNYAGAKAQMAAIAVHAPNAITMGAIILAAGSFLGVMDGSGMLSAIANDAGHLLPDAVAPNLHFLLGVFGVPWELVLNTDAYYFGLLPVVNEIVAPHGASPESVVYALMIGNIVGTFISPFSPALWLALGLSGLEMGRHIRYSLLPMWAFSLALMAVAGLLGVFH